MIKKKRIKIPKEKTHLMEFAKDGKNAYFDFKDGRWQFWGDVPIDESAKLLFEKLGELIDFKIYNKGRINK